VGGRYSGGSTRGWSDSDDGNEESGEESAEDSADDVFGDETVWLLTFCSRDGRPSLGSRSLFVLLTVG
jgi:hypothetical protein